MWIWIWVKWCYLKKFLIVQIFDTEIIDLAAMESNFIIGCGKGVYYQMLRGAINSPNLIWHHRTSWESYQLERQQCNRCFCLYFSYTFLACWYIASFLWCDYCSELVSYMRCKQKNVCGLYGINSLILLPCIYHPPWVDLIPPHYLWNLPISVT